MTIAPPPEEPPDGSVSGGARSVSGVGGALGVGSRAHRRDGDGDRGAAGAGAGAGAGFAAGAGVASAVDPSIPSGGSSAVVAHDDAPVAHNDAPGGLAVALEALRDIQRARSGLDAMEIALYAAVFEHADALAKPTAAPVEERDMMIRSACAEIGAVLRVSDRVVQRRMSDAYDVYTGFPRTFDALRVGDITARHVQEIVNASDGLPVDVRSEYEVAALERALVSTPPRLAAVLPSVANQIHARSITERHQSARKHRSVVVRQADDGMAELIALLPAVLAHGIHDRLTAIAVAVEKTDPDDERCRDEIRADALADILLSGAPVAHGDGLTAIHANVQVTVPVTTLAGETESGADLVGVGPIDAETARILAGGQPGWDRVMTHPVSGAVLAVDRYRPGEDLKRRLRVRDEHCRFPGCRQPAHRCDIDHSVAAADGGKTHLDNLALLCRGHHTMKHAANWQVVHERHGILHWTSPNGRTYVDTPTPVLRFYSSQRDEPCISSRRASGDRSSGADPPQ